MYHPLKSKYSGYPIVMAPILIFTDDTSGNKSKKWNKFDLFSLTMAGLPLHEGRQLHNINFLTCSNALSAMDMTDALVDDLLLLEEGFVVFDSLTQRDIVVLSPVLAILCDNARASELLNHSGARAIKFCRKCMVSEFSIII